MTRVIFNKTGTAKSIRAKVWSDSSDFEKKLIFETNNREELDLAPGKYWLGCVATGKSGSTYKVAVTSPPASRADVRDTISSSGFDFGSEPFEVF